MAVGDPKPGKSSRKKATITLPPVPPPVEITMAEAAHAYMRHGGLATVVDVAQRLSRKGDPERALQALVKEGYLVVPEPGKYRWATFQKAQEMKKLF